jgi:predicted RNase H-like HicB family nuclease
MEMLIEYIDKKLKQARYKLLDDGTYFGKIPGVRGVWANARTKDDCRKELREVLEGWMILKFMDQEKIPGLRINIDRRLLVKN